MTRNTVVVVAGFPVTQVAAALGRDVTTLGASRSRLTAALEKNRGILSLSIHGKGLRWHPLGRISTSKQEAETALFCPH